MPRNNQEFWAKKLQANKDRDKFVNRELRKMGWTVVRVWEHEFSKPEKVAAKIREFILHHLRDVDMEVAFRTLVLQSNKDHTVRLLPCR